MRRRQNATTTATDDGGRDWAVRRCSYSYVRKIDFLLLLFVLYFFVFFLYCVWKAKVFRFEFLFWFCIFSGNLRLSVTTVKRYLNSERFIFAHRQRTALSLAHPHHTISHTDTIRGVRETRAALKFTLWTSKLKVTFMHWHRERERASLDSKENKCVCEGRNGAKRASEKRVSS